MNSLRTILLTACVFLAMHVFIISAKAGNIGNSERPGSIITSVTHIMTYQGILRDNAGNPVPDAAYNITFRIYDSAVGGNLLWTSATIPVQTSSGQFTAEFEPLGLAFDITYYLSLQVGADLEMVGRQRMTAAPYAIIADTTDDLATWYQSGGVTYTAGQYGITKGNSSNMLHGTGAISHVNLGVACTTGVAGQDNIQCTVGGGGVNSASASYSTVGGGVYNKSSGFCATIGGGNDNQTSGDYSTVVGGVGGRADGWVDFIGGGAWNHAAGGASSVGGGQQNFASGDGSTVSGGVGDSASGAYSTIAGGNTNTASGSHATIGGGESNRADANWSTIAGGSTNQAFGHNSSIAGGYLNVTGDAATDTGAFVGGGWLNNANGKFSTVSGGHTNTASGDYSTVSGGYHNNASDAYATIGGGVGNEASTEATVGGGFGNNASGFRGTIAGGFTNIVDGYCSAVSGGIDNAVYGPFSSIPGGANNEIGANAYRSMVFGENVECDNSDYVTFYEGTQYGHLSINRDGNDTYWDFPITAGTTNYNGNGAHLSGGGHWTDGSSRTFKENFTPFNGSELLSKIANLSITTYNMIGTTEKHVGPVAEEFVGLFDTGTIRESDGKRDDMYLAPGDVAGVALAGVQELMKQVEELKKEVAELKAQKGGE